MQLRKKKTPEELRRRKGVSDYVHKVGRGFKQLGTEMLTPASKAGGALISAYKGEPLDITSEELTLAVLSGIVGGKPGGLPAGSVGTGMTRDAATRSLGQSIERLSGRRVFAKALRAFKNFEITPKEYRGIRRNLDTIFPLSDSITKKNAKKMGAALKNTPKEVFKPLTDVYYAPYKDMPPRTTGQNLRSVGSGGESRIRLRKDATAEDFRHETIHSSAYAKKAAAEKAITSGGRPKLDEYYADLLETASKGADQAVAEGKRIGAIDKKARYYADDPTEQHARLGAWALEASKPITGKEYDRAFNAAARPILSTLKDEWPSLYKRTLKRVAGDYRALRGDRRIRERLYKIDSNKFPLENPPKSAKKLTPGEMARALQDAAEAKGPPMYLRRKAGASELPKDIKPRKKPYKIRRMAD